MLNPLFDACREKIPLCGNAINTTFNQDTLGTVCNKTYDLICYGSDGQYQMGPKLTWAFEKFASTTGLPEAYMPTASLTFGLVVLVGILYLRKNGSSEVNDIIDIISKLDTLERLSKHDFKKTLKHIFDGTENKDNKLHDLLTTKLKTLARKHVLNEKAYYEQNPSLFEEEINGAIGDLVRQRLPKALSLLNERRESIKKSANPDEILEEIAEEAIKNTQPSPKPAR